MPGRKSRAGGKDAEEMANMIEKWLGNPLTKSILRFCTKRCKKCGRRIDIALKSYMGTDQRLCTSCKLSAFMVRRILDNITKKIDISNKKAIKRMRDPMWRKGLASVLEGIGKYGPEKPFTAYAPFLVVWNVTRLCNLRCKHCYEDAHTKAPGELDTKQALDAVDKMASAGVAYIAISGGEPLLRPDFFDIAKRIEEDEMAFSIATNGTLLTKEMVKKLEKVNCRYAQISLDGSNAKTHDAFRGRHVFNKTIKGIKNIVRSKITVGIATTVTKYNYKEVPDIIAIAEKLGVDIFMHYNFIPTRRGMDIINMDITPQEREQILVMLARKTRRTKKKKIKLLSTAPQFARVCATHSSISLTHFDTFSQETKLKESVKFLAEFVGGCGAGRLYCALEPNGDIEPCVFIPIIIGNIKKDDLVDVWQNHPILLKIRDRKNFKGNCAICQFKNVCGGCRARSYGYYRDVGASDPGCILNLKDWEKIKKGVKKSSACQ